MILVFASEIAATALLRYLPGGRAEETVTARLEEVVTAFPHGVSALECIVADHMWGKTG